MRKVKGWAAYWMEMAHKITERSKDPSTQVGAIIVTDENYIVSTGYNGFPSKMKETEEDWLNKPVKYDTVIHAEANAVGIAAKRGSRTDGATMYCTHFPCLNCAKTIIAAGIKKLIWQTEVAGWAEENKKAKTLLEKAGVELFQAEPEA